MKFVLEESLQGYIINSFVKDKVLKVVKPRVKLSTALSVVCDDTVIYVGTPTIDADFDKLVNRLPANYLVFPTYPMDSDDKHFVDTKKYSPLYLLSASKGFMNLLSEEDKYLLAYLARGFQNNLGTNSVVYNPDLDTDELQKIFIYYVQNRFSSLSGTAKLLKEDMYDIDFYAYIDNVLEMNKDYIGKKLRLANIATVTSKYSNSKLTIGVVYAERFMNEIALKLLDKIHHEGHEDAIAVIQNANYIMLVMDTDNKELVHGLASSGVQGGYGKYTFFINGLVDLTLFEAMKAELTGENE